VDLLTYEDIAERTGISVGALRKRLAKGTMPKPDLRHGGSPVWFETTLALWMSTASHGDRTHAKRKKP
jgi:transcriptional regulator with XRE-family HTH domain